VSRPATAGSVRRYRLPGHADARTASGRTTVGRRAADGEYHGGWQTYRLRIPLPIPASLFWSVTAYDSMSAQRSILRSWWIASGSWLPGCQLRTPRRQSEWLAPSGPCSR
jgi:hypothetical protein